MKQAVFIVGAARSATTAMLRLLETSSQTSCRLEPTPNLNHESRLMWDGLLSDPYKPLIDSVLPRMSEGFLTSDFYVEKQVSLVSFMRHLHELTHCKFILMKRDGRAAVRSMLDWHNNLFPLFYQEAPESEALSDRAREALENQRRSGTDDLFNLSLPRPRGHREYALLWPHLDRLRMLGYYWNRVNLEICRQVSSLPPDTCIWVDVSELDSAKVRSVFEFVGLGDFDVGLVSAALERRVNSLEDRLGADAEIVRTEWDADADRKLFELASVGMRALGYLDPGRARPRPEGFGRYWTEVETGLDWFEKTYDYRAPLHEVFKGWVGAVGGHEPIASALDAGCGIAFGYHDFFADIEFTGVDMNPRNIDYCSEHYSNPRHRYVCHDLVEEPLPGVYDLVFSHSTIDNVYDPEIFLRNLCRMAGKLLYVSSYRGYFPRFEQHQISWDSENRVYFNDLSPGEITRVLREEGFAQFMVFPQRSHREDIPAETVIIAARTALDPAVFLAHHEIRQAYRPYDVTESGVPLAEVFSRVNRSCDYFSRKPPRADGLDYFGRMLLSILEKDNLKAGALRDFADWSKGLNLALRADVDMDLVAAVEMASISRSVGLGLSFFVLHTAPYYGEWRDGRFYRNGSAAEAYRKIQESGSEIGLHTDAFTIYLGELVDGAEAICTEIEWLRSEGLEILGTAAHNCAPVYGAENFEIFRSRVIGHRASTVRDHSYLPLGVLDETELDLEYEANFATASPRAGSAEAQYYLARLPTADFNRNRGWMRTYLLENPHCEWGFDYRIWHLGSDFWVVAGRRQDGQPVFEFGIPWEDVSAFLDGVDSSEMVVVLLHPAFFGKRWDAGDYPLLAKVSPALAGERPARPDGVDAPVSPLPGELADDL